MKTGLGFIAGPGANRRFGVFPTISGKSVWDLDVDGPIQLSSTSNITIQITPLGAYLDCFVEFWGHGGASGGITPGNGIVNGGVGGAITFAGMTANPGAPNNGASGGAGGTASGGDVNQTGNEGGDADNLGTEVTSGYGAASLASGGNQVVQSVSGDGTAKLNGIPGNAIEYHPGRGASGSAAKFLDSINGQQRRNATGGGGSGGYCKKTFGPGALLGGQTYDLVIGARGSAPSGGITSGGQGAHGRIRIE